MDKLLQFFLIFEDSSISSVTSDSSGTSSADKMGDTLKKIVTSPIFYAVVGGLVLLIILVYLLRRFVRYTPNTAKIVVRQGAIHTIVGENNQKYYLVPFVDRVGAEISLNEKTFTSDQLFINNGPDHLYKVNYTLKYRVINPEKFYPFINGIQETLINVINDGLREFADKGNVMTIINDYREKEQELLEVINSYISKYIVEATSFKINFIEPMGGK